jgi:hypothetical protein
VQRPIHLSRCYNEEQILFHNVLEEVKNSCQKAKKNLTTIKTAKLLR